MAKARHAAIVSSFIIDYQAHGRQVGALRHTPAAAAKAGRVDANRVDTQATASCTFQPFTAADFAACA